MSDLSGSYSATPLDDCNRPISFHKTKQKLPVESAPKYHSFAAASSGVLPHTLTLSGLCADVRCSYANEHDEYAAENMATLATSQKEKQHPQMALVLRLFDCYPPWLVTDGISQGATGVAVLFRTLTG